MADHIDINAYLRIYRPLDGAFSNELCISAHGGYKTSYGWANAPDNSTVNCYELHGSTQTNNRSREIMQGTTLSPTSIATGQVWNYHLTMYEHDAVQIPKDVHSANVDFLMDQKKLTLGKKPFGYVRRDVLSIRTKDLPKETFKEGIPLSYIFTQIQPIHLYSKFHLCFCRYQFMYPGNRFGRQQPGA